MTKNPHILIVQSPYYKRVNDALYDGIMRVFAQHSVTHDVIDVQGAYELPAGVSYAVESMKKNKNATFYDGFIVTGCVLRGQTFHYDHICNTVFQSLLDLSLKHHLALANSILTVNTMQQAYVRADYRQKDHGGHGAKACLRMIDLKKHFGISSLS